AAPAHAQTNPPALSKTSTSPLRASSSRPVNRLPQRTKVFMVCSFETPLRLQGGEGEAHRAAMGGEVGPCPDALESLTSPRPSPPPGGGEGVAPITVPRGA